jgi:prepilin-type N-terminal cleavage/methylation domain-containing protein
MGQRGFTLIETLVAMGIILALVVAVVIASRAFMNGAAAAATQQRSSLNEARLLDMLRADAASSIAIFVPTNTALGTSNSAGNEVDFFSRRADRTPEVYGFLFVAGSNGQPGYVQEYTYDKPNGTATAYGLPMKGFTGLTATSFSADALNDPMFTSPPRRHDIPTGYSGVFAGNHVTRVKLSAMAANNAIETRFAELMAGILPNGVKAVTARWTPQPSRGLSVSPNPINFTAPTGVPAQTFNANDDPYYVGDFLFGSNCGGIAIITPSTTVSLVRDGSSGGQAQYSVSPDPAATASQCTITITDQFGQSASEVVTVAAAAPPGAVDVEPAKVKIPYPGTALSWNDRYQSSGASHWVASTWGFAIAQIPAADFMIAQVSGCSVNEAQPYNADGSAMTAAQAAQYGLTVGADGCIPAGYATTAVGQLNFHGTFFVDRGSCSQYITTGALSPSAQGPGYDSLLVGGAQSTLNTGCQITVNGAVVNGTQTSGHQLVVVTFPVCNGSTPCLYLDASVGDGATYMNADCQVGVNQDCHGAYDYALVGNDGKSKDVTAYLNDYVALSDASGNLYTSSEPAPSPNTAQSTCQNLLWQTATDQGRNGNATLSGVGPMWIQFVSSGSPYSTGQTLAQMIQNAAAAGANGPDKTNGVGC